jgi:uncharacterized protein YpmS
MHDFNLWESRENKLRYKPYINEEAIEPIINPEKISPEEQKSRIEDILAVNKVKAQIFTRRDKSSGNDTIEVEVEQDREEEMKQKILEAMA